MYCDLTSEALLPIIPSSLYKRIFHLFYKLAHPSAKGDRSGHLQGIRVAIDALL